MNQKVKLLMTFDYELFLGQKSGTVDNCLIKPTNLLIELLNNHQIKGIFFVDTTYLLKLDELKETNSSASEDHNKIIQQLTSIVSQGHYVYPHIHPHWKDATYINEINQWKLVDLKYYRAENISDQELEKLFDDSIAILKKYIPKTNNTQYKWAYRAGGWCIQPFQKFSPNFIKNNIVADFSVLAGQNIVNDAIKIDFKGLSNNEKPYTFSESETTPAPNGRFKEFPISSILTPSYKVNIKIIDSILWRLGITKSIGDGIGANFGATKKSFYKNKPLEMVSIELMKKDTIGHYLEFAQNERYIHFISHPKMISKLQLKYLNQFLNVLKKQEDIESDWTELMD